MSKVEVKLGAGQQWAVLRRLTRVPVLPLSIVPVLFGTGLAYGYTHNFSWGLLIITLLGTIAAHAASHTTNDYWDYKSGADEAAEQVEGGVGTNSRLLTSGALKLSEVGWLTVLLFGTALVSAVALTWLVGWPILIFAIGGFLLAYFYVAPPIAYGYIGHGLGEAFVVIAFGVMPVTGAYYVQTGQWNWAVLLASLPIGLYTAAMLLNHAFFQWQADKLVGKNTPVVVLGPVGALWVSMGLFIAAYAGIVLTVLLGLLPWYALVSLATIPLVWRGWLTARTQQDISGYTALRLATLHGNRYTGLLLAASATLAGVVGGFTKLF